MTADQLQQAEATLAVAFAAYETARTERNRLVLAAIHAGWSHAQIARTTNLTRARIGQIALSHSPVD